jgi:glyoxylase-like metal-dependent hydrolase (beta-lactamase superfamily II)
VKLAEKVEMLTVAREGEKMYPVVLWDEAEHLVLIDTGTPGLGAEILREIAALGLEPAKLTHIIITHHDIDHVGGIPEILAVAKNAKVMAHAIETPYIDGSKTPLKLAAFNALGDQIPPDQKVWRDLLTAGFASLQIKVEQNLSEGELLPLCGGLEVILTSGHTLGHISILHKPSNIMISGDALNIANGELVGSEPSYTHDLAAAQAAEAKLKARKAAGYVAYHGGYFPISQEDA